MLYFLQTRPVYLLHGIKLPPNISVDFNSLSENQIKNFRITCTNKMYKFKNVYFMHDMFYILG